MDGVISLIEQILAAKVSPSVKVKAIRGIMREYSDEPGSKDRWAGVRNLSTAFYWGGSPEGDGFWRELDAVIEGGK